MSQHDFGACRDGRDADLCRDCERLQEIAALSKWSHDGFGRIKENGKHVASTDSITASRLASLLNTSGSLEIARACLRRVVDVLIREQGFQFKKAEAAEAKLAELTDRAEVKALDALQRIASLMIAHSFSTGHGDTIEDLLSEFDGQLKELRAKLAKCELLAKDIYEALGPRDNPTGCLDDDLRNIAQGHTGCREYIASLESKLAELLRERDGIAASFEHDADCLSLTRLGLACDCSLWLRVRKDEAEAKLADAWKNAVEQAAEFGLSPTNESSLETMICAIGDGASDKIAKLEAVIATLPTTERLDEMAKHLREKTLHHWEWTENDAMAAELRVVAAAIREQGKITA